MKEYVCHKRVLAARIVNISAPGSGYGCLLHLDDGTDWVWDSIRCATYQPVEGDYVVEYQPDEQDKPPYRSVSPRRAFEAGYTRIMGMVRHTLPAGLDLENPGDKAAITEICNERAALESHQ